MPDYRGFDDQLTVGHKHFVNPFMAWKYL